MVKKFEVLVLAVLVLCGFFARKVVFASETQICNLGGSCVLGEFLYDDNYAPINSEALCTLTSRKPNGDMWLNGVALSIGNSDGWYSYNIDTSGQNEGFYPSQICCTIGTGTTEYMCLDKSFKLETAGLTSLGTLPEQVDLISGKIDALDTKVSGIGTVIDTILSKWSTYSVTDILNSVNGVNSGIGSSNDSCSVNSVFGNIACVKDKWGTQSAQVLFDTAQSVLNVGTSLKNELNYNGKSTTAYEDLQSIKNFVDTLETKVGDESDLSSEETLFGKIKDNKENIDLVPTNVWGYSARTLTNFGNLVSDIWSYTSRSLTNFGTLIANIWGNSERTLTSGTLNSGQLAIQSDVTGIGTSLSESIAGVKNVVDSIETKVNTLDTKVGTINTNVNSLLTKWGVYSVSDLLTNINNINSGIGSSNDSCSVNSVFGNIACVKDKWGTQTAEALYEAANGALSVGNSLRAELNYNGKSNTAYEDIQSLKNYVDSLETSIGSSSDLSSATTIFGKVKENKENITSLSGQVAGVQSSVDSISTKIDSMQITVDTLNTKINSILDKWGSYSIADVLNNVGGISSVLGSETDTCAESESIYGSIACIRDKWGTRTADSLYTTADNALTTISSLRTELNYNGKSTTAYADVQSLKSNVLSLQSMIGNSDDVATTETIFGRIKKVQSVVEVLDGTGIAADGVIDKWGSLSAADIYDKVKNLSSEISAVNTVTNVSSILTLNQASSTDMVALKNQLLSIKALVEINKDLAEKVVDRPIVKTWLEEGSIIFKTMVSNPSTKRQNAAVKFYLPKEAKEKDIMKVDNGISVNYDSEKESLYVTGDFSLAAKETKIISIEITDIWNIAETEITSLKTQSEELTKALENTSYHAQGITLKSDILILLENISRTQKEAITPEAKIQTYRDNISKLNIVKTEVKELKTIVSNLSSNNTMTGFIGGAQTFSLWGMALVIVVSVVALTIYFRVIINKANLGAKQVSHLLKDKKFQKNVGIITTFVFVWMGIFGSTYQGLNIFYKSKKANNAIVKVEKIKKTAEVAVVTEKAEETRVLGAETKEQIKVSPPKDSNSSLKIRNAPDINAEVLGKIWAARTVDKYIESDGWTKIGTTLTIENKEEYVSGWIRSEYIIK